MNLIKIFSLTKMKVVDAIIIDQTPLADKYAKQYDKKYK